jgi:hypothetical protein
VKSAHRSHTQELFCAAHYPGLATDENKVIKREALLGKVCVTCGAAFITETPDKPHRDAFRETWAKEVAEGRALPIAGDLFPETTEER